jgi:glycosyltransferase involved in cell wall biosynthesis
MTKTPVSIVILTFNEEINLRSCLASVTDMTDEVFIVDSLSTDKTLEIARKYTEKIFRNAWTNYAGQKQWAMENLPFTHDWVLFFDADERLTDPLKGEIHQVINAELKNPSFGGYYVAKKFIFLKKTILWGDCRGDKGELRLCNRHHISIAERAGHPVYVSDIEVSHLKEPLIHEDQKPLAAWINRHNTYSSEEAQYLWGTKQKKGRVLLHKSMASLDKQLYWKEVMREKIWHKLPIGFRPTLLFIYSYFLRLGFLDGVAGFMYHFLHTFWYRLLIDAKLIELERSDRSIVL